MVLTIATALPWEAGAFVGRLHSRRRTTLADGWAIHGFRRNVELRVVVSGPGRERAQRAAAALSDLEPQTTGLLSLGVAGGLTAGARAGDLVLARRLQRRHADGGNAGPPLPSDEQFRGFVARALDSRGVRHQLGDTLTTDRVLFTPDEKRSHAEHSGALAVQLEDAVWAEAATQWQVPMVALRAVLDGVSTPVPESIVAWDWQRPKIARIAFDALRSPRLALALAGFAWRRRRAVGALDRALEAIVAMQPGGAP